MGRTCSVEGCERQVRANGFCQKHDVANKRYGDPLGRRRNERGVASRHPLWATWTGMRQRCLDQSYERYQDYGGRGISICEEWLEDFWTFVDDMWPKPSREHSLDRRDNDGPYSKDNCRWATVEEQMDNRRNTRIDADGRARVMDMYQNTGLPKRQIARTLGLPYDAVMRTIKNSKMVRDEPESMSEVNAADMESRVAVKTATCMIQRCDGEHYAKGLCRKHYRWGDSKTMAGGEVTTISCQQCGKEVLARRVDSKFCDLTCKSAWHRAHKPEPAHDAARCSVEGCERVSKCQGMCQSHYMRHYHATKGRNSGQEN